MYPLRLGVQRIGAVAGGQRLLDEGQLRIDCGQRSGRTIEGTNQFFGTAFKDNTLVLCRAGQRRFANRDHVERLALAKIATNTVDALFQRCGVAPRRDENTLVIVRVALLARRPGVDGRVGKVPGNAMEAGTGRRIDVANDVAGRIGNRQYDGRCVFELLKTQSVPSPGTSRSRFRLRAPARARGVHRALSARASGT